MEAMDIDKERMKDWPRVGPNQSTRSPYSEIVWVWAKEKNGGWATGTGSMLDASHVVTAAHVVSGNLEAVFCYPGYNNRYDQPTPPPNGIAARRVFVPKLYAQGIETAAMDVAVIELAAPHGGHGSFFTLLDDEKRLAKLGEGEDLTLAGYPAGPDGQQHVDTGPHTIINIRDNYVDYEIKTEYGVSGAPLYYYDSVNDVTWLCAVHSASEEGKRPRQFERRHGVLITKQVRDWIRAAVGRAPGGSFLQFL